MDTSEKKVVANQTPREDGEASTEIPSPSKDFEVDNKEGEEITVKQSKEEPPEKETTDNDAGEDDVRLEAEVMAGKKRHLIKEATLFPRFFIMFGVRMVAGI